MQVTAQFSSLEKWNFRVCCTWGFDFENVEVIQVLEFKDIQAPLLLVTKYCVSTATVSICNATYQVPQFWPLLIIKQVCCSITFDTLFAHLLLQPLHLQYSQHSQHKVYQHFTSHSNNHGFHSQFHYTIYSLHHSSLQAGPKIL